MSAASRKSVLRPDLSKRQRTLFTPEGLALPLVVGGRGARAGAFLIDLVIFLIALIILQVFFQLLLGALLGIDFDAQVDNPSPVFEFFYVLAIVIVFFARYGYFVFFELGPRGATPGKRIVGLRVAARDGGQLTAEMVIARNLARDVEIYFPMIYMFAVLIGTIAGADLLGITGWAAFVWLMVFLLFPFFNKDALRAGDLVAGTWVVEARKAKLETAMSLAPDRTSEYRFGEEELSVYGEHELQVLERVLRQDRPESLREVAEAITNKIGWQLGRGDEREFLEAFYAALRGHLEGRMRFGKRKADKFS